MLLEMLESKIQPKKKYSGDETFDVAFLSFGLFTVNTGSRKSGTQYSCMCIPKMDANLMTDAQRVIYVFTRPAAAVFGQLTQTITCTSEFRNRRKDKSKFLKKNTLLAILRVAERGAACIANTAYCQ